MHCTHIGDPNASKGSEQILLYEKGVNLFGEAGLIRAVLQLTLAGLYPTLLRNGIQAGHIIGVCFAAYSTAIFMFAHTKVARLGELVVIMMGFPSAVLYTIPVGLTVAKSDESNRGRYLGALNCFAVIPQLIDTSYTGFVSERFGEATVMLIGAAWGVITAISAVFVMKKG